MYSTSDFGLDDLLWRQCTARNPHTVQQHLQQAGVTDKNPQGCVSSSPCATACSHMDCALANASQALPQCSHDPRNSLSAATAGWRLHLSVCTACRSTRCPIHDCDAEPALAYCHGHKIKAEVRGMRRACCPCWQAAQQAVLERRLRGQQHCTTQLPGHPLQLVHGGRGDHQRIQQYVLLPHLRHLLKAAHHLLRQGIAAAATAAGSLRCLASTDVEAAVHC
mmetsp:Transcript_40538/g.90090  ORF Transcript_40538/g.90090 Transcript_40538/m.90090 type:complete len:222 (+) Transcript_40538:1007-1672(+)